MSPASSSSLTSSWDLPSASTVIPDFPWETPPPTTPPLGGASLLLTLPLLLASTGCKERATPSHLHLSLPEVRTTHTHLSPTVLTAVTAKPRPCARLAWMTAAPASPFAYLSSNSPIRESTSGQAIRQQSSLSSTNSVFISCPLQLLEAWPHLQLPTTQNHSSSKTLTTDTPLRRQLASYPPPPTPHKRDTSTQRGTQQALNSVHPVLSVLCISSRPRPPASSLPRCPGHLGPVPPPGLPEPRLPPPPSTSRSASGPLSIMRLRHKVPNPEWVQTPSVYI